MKTKTNKIISLAVVMALLLSLFSGVTFSGGMEKAFAETDVSLDLFDYDCYTELAGEYVDSNGHNAWNISLDGSSAVYAYLEENSDETVIYKHEFTNYWLYNNSSIGINDRFESTMYNDLTHEEFLVAYGIDTEFEYKILYVNYCVLSNTSTDDNGAIKTEFTYFANNVESETKGYIETTIAEDMDTTYTLKVCGEGRTANYVDITTWNPTDTPWVNYVDEITSLKLGEGIIELGHSLFRDLDRLYEMVDFPATLEICGSQTFGSCDSLMSVVFNEGLQFVKSYAFSQAYGLIGDIVIPNSIQGLGTAMFNRCYFLNGALTLPEEFSDITDDLLTILGVESISQLGASIFCYNNFSGELVLPTNIDTIPSNTFVGNHNFEGVLEIPDYIKTIDYYAFRHMSGIEILVFSDGIEYIGNEAFAMMSSLHTIDLTNINTDVSFGDNFVFQQAKNDCIAYMEYIEFKDKYTNFSGSVAITNGGTFDTNAEFYAEEYVSGTLATPTKEEYVFTGWYDNAALTGEAVTTVTSGETYYAKWVDENFDVTFDSNCDVTDVIVNMTHGDSITQTMTRTGYTFLGWSETTDGDVIDTTTYTVDALNQIDFYAQWQANSYTLTYTLDGWVAEDSDGTFTYGTDKTLPTPTKEGYTFDGWYKESDYSDSKITEIPSTAITENIVLYAKWIAIEYDITYEVYDSVVTEGDVTNDNTATYTIEDTITLASPTLDGYLFIGWYDAESEGDIVTTISNSTEAITLYAKWLDLTTDTDGTAFKAQVAADITSLTSGLDNAEDAAIIGAISDIMNTATVDDYYETKLLAEFLTDAEVVALVSCFGENDKLSFSVPTDSEVTNILVKEEIISSDATKMEDLGEYTAVVGTYTFKATDDDKKLITGEIAGGIDVTIPFADYEDGMEYFIAHLKSDGKIEYLPTTYDAEDSTLSFTITSCSSFIVVAKEQEVVATSTGITLNSKYTVGGSSSSDVEEPAETPVPEVPVETQKPVEPTVTPSPTVAPTPAPAPAESGSGAWIWIILGVLVIGGVAGCVVYKKKK